MRHAVTTISAGADVTAMLVMLKNEVLAAGFRAVDYVDLRDAETLEALDHFDGRPARLLVAAHIGNARLIDNLPSA
jgi:pantoate--beta-alanine ligase